MLIAFATLYDWDIDHLDAVGAFLQGSIEEKIFMHLPDELEFSKERGKERLVYELEFSKERDLGLTCADFHCCVYYMTNGIYILLVAVDNLLIFSSCPELKLRIKEKIFQMFKLKYLGELKYCLDI